ncbi:MAG: RHS repeat-associated core domain-containing protein [Verrucomicrobiales bacterium]|nr:RHS repeat-associated core domain-containing protein [Verrucomicrobiales bacterium]
MSSSLSSSSHSSYSFPSSSTTSSSSSHTSSPSSSSYYSSSFSYPSTSSYSSYWSSSSSSSSSDYYSSDSSYSSLPDDDTEEPEKDPGCDSPQSGNPIGYAAGQISLSETDFSWQGMGFSWSHTRSYANVVEGAVPGRLGERWFLTDLPSLSFGTEGGLVTVGVIAGAYKSDWFISDGSGGWINRYGNHSTLNYDSGAAEFTLIRPNGRTEIFHDDSAGVNAALRGKLKDLTSAGGAEAEVTYNTSFQLESVYWTSANGETAEFSYTYFGDAQRLGLMETATLSVNGVAIRLASYDYYVTGDTHGPARVLKSADVQGKDDGQWESIGKQWYRYYTSTGGVGVLYGLKLCLDDNGTAAAEQAGIDLDSASDETLAPYASHWFEFNGDARVTKEIVRGGESTYNFAWMTSDADPSLTDSNTWYRQCTETRPDGTKKIVYTNRGGSLILSILEEIASGDRWYEYRTYDSQNRVLQKVSSEAVQSVSEPANVSGSLSVTLKANDGLITVNSYFSSDDFPNGEVEGYLASRGVKEGSSGSVVITHKWTYDTQTVGSASVHPVKEELVFMTAGVPDNEASTTTYTRTWYTDTLQEKQVTTTMPVVSTSQHGTGNNETTDEIYDENGFNIWSRDGRGIITRRFFDLVTGAVSRIINDADPSQLDDPPAGWSAPSFGGANLITDIINDKLGRPIRVLGPEHAAVVDEEGTGNLCESASVTAKTVRSVEYTVYLCPRHQTWMAKGYVSGFATPNESWHLLGPVQIEQRDFESNVIDQIAAVATCDCGPLSLGSFGELDSYNDLPQRQHWSAWTHTERDYWGRETGQRAYFDIPQSGIGFQNENYYRSEQGYDSMNRPDRLVSRDGTITWTSYDPPGDPSATWTGTDDIGATASDPGNGGADGNNLKITLAIEYDDGNAGGNRNLTKETRPVDDTPANDRVIENDYDFRNRLTQSQTSDGTTLFITAITYDNVDNPLTETGYHTSVNDTNRIARKETEYDGRNRVFEVNTYGVDPANGNLTNALTAGTWYDEDDNVIKQTEPGQNGATKTDYNGRNLPTVTYAVIPGTPPSGEPANDISDDTVVEQEEMTYNDANLAITTTTRLRLPDSTGKVALGGATGSQPRARVLWSEMYFDGIKRSRFAAEYGTNGGTAPRRPDTPATPSETVLVTENKFDAAGYQSKTVAPDGVINRSEFDDLGQLTTTIEAYGTADARTQHYRWHPSGRMEFLMLENPDTGQQVTKWSYGSTLAASGVARNDIMVGKQYPTGESASYTVNRQGEQGGMVQPNGTTHEYTYNKIGQILHDAVTAVASGINDTVLRISTTYTNRGLEETVTSWDNATPGSGSVVNEVKFSYDAFNQVITDEQEHSGAVGGSTPAVSYAFTDGSSNTLRQASVTAPSGIQTNYEYGTAGSIDDIFNRTASLQIQGEGSNLVEYQYAGAGLIADIFYPTPDAELSYIAKTGATGTGDGGDTLTGYDRFNRIIKMPWKNKTTATVLANIGYGYDEASRRTWRQDLTPAADREHDRYYTYDHLSQVKSVAVGTLNDNRTAIGGVAAEDESWNYDETGNWLNYSKAEDGTVSINETRTNNESNQIKTIDGFSSGIAHDLNGNVTLLPTGEGLTGPSRTLKWDGWNRLIEVRNASDNSLVGAYAYDGKFRRTTSFDSGSTVTHYYYNRNWRAVEERLDASTDPKNGYYWGAQNRWELVRRDRDTNDNGTLDEALYCLSDAMDPVAIVDGSGNVVERYEYSAFGNVSFFAADYSGRATSSYVWKFLFHGEFRDVDTAMYNYGYRYYDPNSGRWTSRDPIGEDGGVNLYAYVRNLILNSVDGFGLQDVFTRWGSGHAGSRGNGPVPGPPPYDGGPKESPLPPGTGNDPLPDWPYDGPTQDPNDPPLRYDPLSNPQPKPSPSPNPSPSPSPPTYMPPRKPPVNSLGEHFMQTFLHGLGKACGTNTGLPGVLIDAGKLGGAIEALKKYNDCLELNNGNPHCCEKEKEIIDSICTKL